MAGHLRDLILQLLFTEPGERLNLPELGCGVKRLVFAPNSDILQATVQFLITQNLRRWLADQIDILGVTALAPPGEENTMQVEITYRERATRIRRQLRVSVP
jgi:phage baseplate assembly protein W